MQSHLSFNEENRILITKNYILEIACKELGLLLDENQVDEVEGIMLESLPAFTLTCIRKNIKIN